MQYGDYEIVRYTPEYKDSLLNLLSLLWGTDTQNNLEYFNWKYEQNPYADRCWIYLALYDGQPVAVRGNMAMRWQVDDPIQYINCMCDGDAVVLPEHRRKGLYETMTQFNIRDLEKTSFRYFVTTNANDKTAAGNLKLGWQLLASIQPLVRLRPRPVIAESKLKKSIQSLPLARKTYVALRKLLHRNAPPASPYAKTKSPFDALDNQKIKPKEKYPHLSIEDIARPFEMADLVARLPADGRMRHVRDAEFFKWRYCNPRSNYRFLFWGEQPLDGYLILRMPSRGGYPVTIVDWEGINTAVRTELLKAAIQLADFDVLKTWGISLTVPTMELLLQLGFFQEIENLEQENYEPKVLLRLAKEQPQDADWQVGTKYLLDLQSWYFRPIDGDAY